VANLTERVARDTRAFYVLQIELDLLLTPARPEASEEQEETAEGTCSEGDSRGGAGAAAAAPRGQRAGGEEEAVVRRGNVRIMGAVNEEAITRVWLARRDGRGAFLTCDAPNGAPLFAFARCFAC
jgi:hypothetical protein